MQKPLGAILVALTACSGPQTTADAGFDAGTDAGTGPADAGPPAPIAIMGLFATETDAGTRLQAFIEVNGGVAHDFDDGVCTADRVRRRDGDAAWLRISGYTAPGQPILCTDEDAGYVCRFPSGVDLTAPASVEFAAPLDPIGAGPVAFATGGGASVGAAFVRVPRAAGRLTVQEDLSGLPGRPRSTRSARARSRSPRGAARASERPSSGCRAPPAGSPCRKISRGCRARCTSTAPAATAATCS